MHHFIDTCVSDIVQDYRSVSPFINAMMQQLSSGCTSLHNVHQHVVGCNVS